MADGVSTGGPQRPGGNGPQRKLSVIQWNCRSVTGKVPFLTDYLRDHPQTDLLLLQSLGVEPRALPRLDGFFFPPVTSCEKGKAQTVTYVSTRLTYTTPDLPTYDSDTRLIRCAVRIPVKGSKPITLINVYYPGGCLNADSVQWLQTLDARSDNWVVAGDFNASHRLWDSGADNRTGNGDSLADAISDSDLVVLNDGPFTRIGYENQRSSAIDLTLVSADLAASATWNVGTDPLQSDHLPLHLVLDDADPDEAEMDRTPKFQYHKADWQLFQSRLAAECTHRDPSDPDTETYYENIRNMILAAADAAIPKRAPGPGGKHRHSASWWNTACAEATTAKRRALRRFKTDMSEANRTALREATAKCRATADNAKREHWEQFCLSEVHGPQDSGKLWKKVNKFKKGTRAPEKPLLVDGQITRNAREKAEALATTFAKASQTQHLPEEAREYRQEEEQNFEAPAEDNSAPHNSDLTVGELKSVLGKLGSAGKASGRDPISYQMLRQLPAAMIEILLRFYQKCWDTGTIPKAWKEALVIAIPKEGKPQQLPTSYRPIALTPHLGKVYERLIKSRLEHFLEKHDILPLCQAGFRRGRSCMEHVVRLTEHVKKTLAARDTTVATFFDIKRAFDTVWHGKLLDKLRTIGVSGRMYQFIQAFLDSRQMAVKVGEAVSRTHTLDMGVPQGSVIAPTLFCIMLYDIETVSRPGFHLALFADDLALHADIRGRCKGYIDSWLKRYQGCVDDIQEYMEDNGFSLSVEKTALMVFTRQASSRQRYYLELDDTVITPSEEVKFLGVTLNQNLTWGTHIRSLQTKARRGVALIKALAGMTWVTPQNLVHLTGALVRSRLTYGQEAFPTAPRGEMVLLERVEMQALKLALGLNRGAINDLVYQEVGWLPLSEEMRKRCANFEARVHAVPTCVADYVGQDPDPDREAARKRLIPKRPRIHQRTTPLSSYTKPLWAECGTQPERVIQNSAPPLPLWELAKPSFILSHGENLCKESDGLYLATLARELLQGELASHMHIFTDGSVQENGAVGCAFVVPDLKITRKFKLNVGTNIFTAELYAILKACSEVNDMPQAPRRVAILTDSKSSLQALAAGGTTNRGGLQAGILQTAHEIITKGTALTMMWLPSHCGIRGNDQADAEAKAASREGRSNDLGLSQAELRTLVRKAAWKAREAKLQARCQDHGWLHLPGRNMLHPQMPRKLSRVLRRIRTVCCTLNHTNPTCPCGEKISLRHALTRCAAMTPTLSPLWDYQRTHNLATHEFLQKHPTLGVEPMKMLAATLVASPIGEWF
jgi:ribonuclease HI/exonuclease III